MRLRSWLLLFALGLFVVSGCESGDDDAGVGPGSGGDTPNTNVRVSPFLTDVIIPGGDGVGVGTEITLVGLNFANDLTQNVVDFSAGSQQVRGLPLAVTFPTDGDPSNGLESQLVVAVPGGVSTGNLTLTVNGIIAGQRGYSATPQVMALSLGRNRDVEVLSYDAQLGFQENSFLELHGLNFSELTEVRLSDLEGNVVRIPTNTVERGAQSDLGENNGYSIIGFALRDDRNDVRLSFPANRDNMQVTISAAGGSSNTVEAPVVQLLALDVNQAPEELGAVLNGVKVPTGARTGPVPIHYSIYEGEIAASWFINVEWKVVSDDESSWQVAKPAEDIENHDGTEGILAGTINHPSGYRLFPAGGTVRTFVWDAANDPNVCERFRRDAFSPFNQGRRHQTIHFRISPEIDTGATDRPVQTRDHAWVTPPILYYYMEELPGDDTLATQTDRELFEGFIDNAREDTSLTTASWGPPNNRGAVQGQFPDPDDPLPIFGNGTDDVVLGRDRSIGDNVLQFWTIDTTTDRLRITFNSIDDNGSPEDPTDDIEAQIPLQLNNPGAAIQEFHVRTFRVENGMDVFVSGENPLVIRCSGSGEEEDEVFFVDGFLDCRGQPGGMTPLVRGVAQTLSQLSTGGSGGTGGPGSFRGGKGASLVLSTPFQNARVLSLIAADKGENSGGFGGETTAAVDFDPDNISAFTGGAGGGGGHRGNGQTGDSGRPTPIGFQAAKPGDGGLTRGDPGLVEFTVGSGGGGGGATITRPDTTANVQTRVALGGGGGGGGGGLVQIVANGTVRVSEGGAVSVDGGEGGSSFGDGIEVGNDSITVEAGGAGGGGSAGSILIQATGSVISDCDGLQANGGFAGQSGRGVNLDVGRSGTQNLVGGAGTGAPGYIRIETREGRAPTCSTLVGATTLMGRLEDRGVISPCIFVNDSSFVVEDSKSFPSSGEIVVTGVVGLVENSRCIEPEAEDLVSPVGTVQTEEMRYFQKTDVAPGDDEAMQYGLLSRIARGENEGKAFVFEEGAEILLKASVFPLGGAPLSEGQVVTAPEPIGLGAAADGELHLQFIPSLDSSTGELRRNEDGELISVWTFNTDTGVLSNPLGEPLLEVAAAAVNPGLIDLSLLAIDANTILRAEGSRPLIITVRQQADILGTIDVSGFDGGALRFRSATPSDPESGLGGEGGAGGAAGGDGGRIEFVNGDSADKDPANTIPINGEAGELPPETPAEWDVTPVPFGDGRNPDDIVTLPRVARATGGSSVRAQLPGRPCDPVEPDCDVTPVTVTAGGGAGGGNLVAGDSAPGGLDENGESILEYDGIPVGFPPLGTDSPGTGGSQFGTDSSRLDGDLWLFGGTGGSGGGAHFATSTSYVNGILPDEGVVFGGVGTTNKALHSPGTGGGGGGGVLYLAGENIFIRETGQLLARGGDAFQGIDLGGNGGGGAGGIIIIQARSSLTIAQDAILDVSGGRANRAPPIDPGQQLPLYEGNVNVGEGSEVSFFGGAGGNGAPGRVRIEIEGDTSLLSSGVNPSVSTGRFFTGNFSSVAFSTPIRLALGPGNAVASGSLNVTGAVIRFSEFGRPLGTNSVVLWEGAQESLDDHGAVGDFVQRDRDLRSLRFSEWVRFSVPFQSSVGAQQTQSIQDIQFQYSYEPLPDTECFFN